MEAYVSAVCSEIQLAAAACKAEGGAHAEQVPLRTVFFGGGTPSLLPPPQLGRILDTFRSAFGIADGAEISLEMDPGALAGRAAGRCSPRSVAHSLCSVMSTPHHSIPWDWQRLTEVLTLEESPQPAPPPPLTVPFTRPLRSPCAAARDV